MKLGIVGKGNFSKLLISKLTELNIPYVLYDHSDNDDLLLEVLSCNYIILAIPVQYIENFIKNINNQIIIDICSVKNYPKEIYERNNIKAILTHPMFGPNSILKNGWKNQKIMLDFSLVSKVERKKFLKIIKILNLKHLEMSSDEHDKITARTLALHQVFGRVMPSLKEEVLDTENYRLLFEIYNSVNSDSDDVFNSILRYNKHVKEEIILIKKKLDNIIGS